MLICFTDLDGTLLNHDDYQYDAAIPIIQKLKALGVPIIPNTSKTRAEVIDLRRALALTDPFVVENGSGIFLEGADARFEFSTQSTDSQLTKVYLGMSYEEAQVALQDLSQFVGESLKGFSTMTQAELIAATHLSTQDLTRACHREFSEPFIKPDHVPVKALEAWASQNQYQILVGNRFCHLLGVGAGKGNAVKTLKAAFRIADNITTVGLGDSPNDLSMLEAVDIPIVIPGKHGPHRQLAERGWTIAPERGCRGWAAVMEMVAQQQGLWA